MYGKQRSKNTVLAKKSDNHLNIYLFHCPKCVPPQENKRNLSQSFSVAEQFTGMPGQYVPLKETIRGFSMIIDGECDDIPESCFLFAGTIDEVFKKAGKAGTV